MPVLIVGLWIAWEFMEIKGILGNYWASTTSAGQIAFNFRFRSELKAPHIDAILFKYTISSNSCTFGEFPPNSQKIPTLQEKFAFSGSNPKKTN